MSFSLEMQQQDKRARLVTGLVLAVATVWGIFRISRSLDILFDVSHDLYTYYTVWQVLLHRDMADLALQGSLYLPHTWVAMTPVLAFGWPAARILMLLANFVAVLSIWTCLSRLAGLTGLKRWLLLALFCGWVSTGVVIGLGNLALVCTASAIAAFPFCTWGGSTFLTLSAMKQSLVFPLYFNLLFKRPRFLILPFAIFAVCGMAALLWAKLTPGEAIRMFRETMSSVSGFTQYDHTCLRRLLTPFISSPQVVSAANWLIWFGLYGATLRWMKDPLTRFASLMLLSLLPLYHNAYDMVAAVPALAVLLRRCHLALSVLLTAVLAVDLPAILVERLQDGTLKAFVEGFDRAYLPIIILLTLGGLMMLEIKRPIVGDNVSPPATNPQNPG